MPSSSQFPAASLFLLSGSKEHMIPITVLLSQQTVKAERQSLLPGL